MIKLLMLLIPQIVFAATPLTFPVFLREGFSTVLEFEEQPTKVVLGDSQSFQVEKLDKSIVIKTLVPYATSNMFVYFKEKNTRLFVLTASEDAEPTYYKKFESLIPAKKPFINAAKTLKRGMSLKSAKFSPKKDFLTVEVLVSADSAQRLQPKWEKVRLTYGKSAISPNKLWSERKEVQKDSSVVARFIFNKPNLSANLKDTKIVLPIDGSTTPLIVLIAGRIR